LADLVETKPEIEKISYKNLAMPSHITPSLLPMTEGGRGNGQKQLPVIMIFFLHVSDLVVSAIL
jgi:hypothetical protein